MNYQIMHINTYFYASSKTIDVSVQMQPSNPSAARLVIDLTPEHGAQVAALIAELAQKQLEAAEQEMEHPRPMTVTAIEQLAPPEAPEPAPVYAEYTEDSGPAF